MHVWNIELIPRPVFDWAGILGLVALSAAVVAIIIGSWAAWRHPVGTDTFATVHLSKVVKHLVVLGLILLVIWSMPWTLAHSIPTGPVPIGGNARW